MPSEQCMDIWAVVPEMALAGLALALVPVAAFTRGRWRALPSLAAVLGLVATLAVTASMLATPPTDAFCGTWAVDRFASFYKLLIEFGSLVTIVVLASHFHGHQAMGHAPLIVLFTTVGGIGLVA